jgi:hypothetical protein
MVWMIIGTLLLLCLLGIIGQVGGAFIFLLPVAAVVVFIVNLLTGRQAV